MLVVVAVVVLRLLLGCTFKGSGRDPVKKGLTLPGGMETRWGVGREVVG